MRSRIALIVAAVVALVGLGGATVALSAAPSSSGLCAKNGSRAVVYFANCPAGYFPITLPAGTKLVSAPAPAVSPVKIVHGAVTLTASSPATQVVTLTGLPAYSPSLLATWGSNADSAPAAPVAVAVSPLAPAAGSTERQFRVTQSGFAVGQSFTVDVWALVVQA